MKEKYELLKEISYANIGDPIRFNNDKRYFEIKSSKYSLLGWVFFAPAIADTLVKGGWMRKRKPREKVKERQPREWFEIEGTLEQEFWGRRFESQLEAKQYMDIKKYPGGFSIIKVQEVTEDIGNNTKKLDNGMIDKGEPSIKLAEE